MTGRRDKRYLIVNADDFGQSVGVNRGIIEAREGGIVTSASLMVRWPAAVAAAAYSRKHESLSVGLHFDFAEWTCRRGKWVLLYQVVPESDVKAVAKEALRQLSAFRRLIGRDPTHIDSHQHAHLSKPVNPIFVEIAESLGVPLRGCTAEVRYCGKFYGQTQNGHPLPDFISVNALLKILATLRPGFTELGCHPGRTAGLHAMYRTERVKEMKTLCDPRIRAAIAEMGVELCSFDVVAARALKCGNGRART